MIYSGNAHKEEKHEKVVAIMLSKEGKNALLEWETTFEKIIWARFNARYYNIIVINAYAPTNENSDERNRIL